jgi:hypothetical protein
MRVLLFGALLTCCCVDRGSIWVGGSDDCVMDVATGECAVSAQEVEERDPNLRPMTYNVGDGEQSAHVFVPPTLEEMYQQKKQDISGALQKVTPDFNGFAGKFINMSNKKCTLFW